MKAAEAQARSYSSLILHPSSLISGPIFAQLLASPLFRRVLINRTRIVRKNPQHIPTPWVI